MKKTLFFFGLFLFLIFLGSCKKCYHCQNTCVQCVYLYQGHTISHTLCVDSFATPADYNAAISNDSAYGYVCTSAASTYTYDFCVNKPGDENYVNYFNEGGRATCTVK